MEEKQIAQIIKSAIEVPGILMVVIFGIKWVVKDYFAKRTELETLKEKLKQQEVEQLESQIKNLESKIESLQDAVKEHRDAIKQHSRAMTETENQSAKVLEAVKTYADKSSHSITEYARLTHERLKRIEKTETVDLGNGKVLIKNKP